MKAQPPWPIGGAQFCRRCLNKLTPGHTCPPDPFTARGNQ